MDYQEKIEELRQQGVKWLELDYRINNLDVYQFTVEALDYAKPDFFFIPPARNKEHHPEYTHGVGGLLRHTKAALVLAQELFPIYNFGELTQDYIISALTLHDIEKPSKTHPIQVKYRIEPLRDKYWNIFKEVIPLIEPHMGQWDYYERLPRPVTITQDFVHLCDYLASRRVLTVKI